MYQENRNVSRRDGGGTFGSPTEVIGFDPLRRYSIPHVALNAPSGRTLPSLRRPLRHSWEITPVALLCLSTLTENPKWSRNNRSLISIHRLPLYKGAFTRAIYVPVPTHVKDRSLLAPSVLSGVQWRIILNGRVTFDVEKIIMLRRDSVDYSKINFHMLSSSFSLCFSSKLSQFEILHSFIYIGI